MFLFDFSRDLAFPSAHTSVFFLTQLAREHNVFKVEAVGDAYLAVAGVPDADAKHAVHMARFCRAVVDQASRLTKKLEIKL